MRNIKLISLLCALVFLGACEVKMAPSKFWDKIFKPDTDSKYYEKKSEKLVSVLTEDVEEYEINKVVVLDLVDDEDRVPVLGQVHVQPCSGGDHPQSVIFVWPSEAKS